MFPNNAQGVERIYTFTTPPAPFLLHPAPITPKVGEVA